MQGTLNEIDIRSILQLIELGQRTGQLFVQTYLPPAYSTNSQTNPSPKDLEGEVKQHFSGSFWFVFFVNGEIVYATDGDASLSRLHDYLYPYQPEAVDTSLEVPSIASTNAPEYGYLWALLEKHILTPAQGRTIIQSMVQETLFDLFSLHQGSFIFEMGPALTPQLATWEIAPLVTETVKQVQEWKQFHPHIQSPHQCPVITEPAKLSAALPKNAFKTLDTFANGKTSLRQIARYLNRDLLAVSRAIYSYIKQGWVQLVNPIAEEVSASHRSFRQTDKVPHIVCIDDDITVRKTLEYILKQKGYQVTLLDNPLKALSLVFKLKPDLILCDIAMPELDGYEVCAMLRHSTAFRQTPIVMLTGMDGFIDRVRAQMVGASDYLTKPFGESELVMLLEKYIGQVNEPSITRDNTLRDEFIQEEMA